jgi:outer membrane translocation and assembly module TamA
MDAGVIRGPAFGRTLAQASLELQRNVYRRGPLTIGLAGFVDAAQAWHRLDGTRSKLHVDGGIGLRLRLASAAPVIRIDWAGGLRDNSTALSVGLIILED